MSINVGDAVLTFLGDTQNLDQAFDRVNRDSKTKLQPVSNTIQDVGGQWQFTGQTASTAGDLSLQAAGKMEEAGHRGASAFHETRGAVDLLAHGFGIELPRELKSFLAELGPVQGLLAGAFEGIAIVGLIVALVEGTEKLAEWVAETFIFTDAMRASNAVAAEVNKKIAEQVVELGKLKDAYASIGLQGSALTIANFDKLSRSVADNSEKLRAFQDEIFGLRNGMVTLPEAISVVNTHIHDLFKDLPEEELKKKLLPDDATFDAVVAKLRDFVGLQKSIIDSANEQLANIQKQFDIQTLEEKIAVQEARIQATKQGGDAELNLQLQLALTRNAQLKNGYGSDLEAQIEYNSKKYQNEKTAFSAQHALADQKLQHDKDNLENEKSLLGPTDPQAAAKIAAIDQEIQSVERQHAASIIAIDGAIVEAKKQHEAQIVSDYRQALSTLKSETTKFAEAERSEILALISSATASPAVVDSFNPWKQSLSELASAYQILGFDGVGALTVKLNEQEAALSRLYAAVANGTATEEDYKRGLLAVRETELDLAHAEDDGTEASKRRIAVLEQLAKSQKDKMAYEEQVLRRASSSWKAFFEILTTGSLHSSHAVQIGFQLTTEAIGGAVEAAVMGQQSFGQAMQQWAKSTLAALAAEAVVQAIYNTAWGFYYLAHRDFVGATDSFTAAAEFGAVAAAAAIAGSAIPSGSSSGDSGSSASTATDTGQPAASPAPQPVQTVNVQHLATGGIVLRRLLLGDSRTGGDQKEAVLPLEDPDAMTMVARAIIGQLPSVIPPRIIQEPSRQLASLVAGTTSEMESTRRQFLDSRDSARSGDGDMHLNFDFTGVALSSDRTKLKNMAKDLAGHITRGVKRGDIRLLASDSFKLTRRS